MNEPIAITGLGLLSPLGVGADETLSALCAGTTGIRPGCRLAPPSGVTPLCGEVPDFRVEDFLTTPKTYLDRNSALLLAATGMALRQAGIAQDSIHPERMGILAGTAWGGQDSMAAFFSDYVKKGARLVKPFLFPHTYFNTAVSFAAIEWTLRGVHQSFASGRLASGHALVEACDLLGDGAADFIVAGGCEALGASLLQTWATLGVLAPATQTEGSRVFDIAHAGFVPGEGSAMLALERVSHARARGARILATLTSCGLSGSPGKVGPAQALATALQEAGVTASQLAGLCVSANGCAEVDRAEAQGLVDLLNGARVPVTAPVAICGDTQGACAALHTALVVLMSRVGALPPIAGLVTPEISGLNYVTRAHEWRTGPVAILTTDPTGSAVALVLERSHD